MIVLNNKDQTSEHHMEHDKMSLEELFKKELDAYCAYKKWSEDTEDDILEMALEEIMLDEYLHAKFLRDYMIDNDMYKLTDSDPHEKLFWKAGKKLFKM
jgi:hypothetical protein